METNYLNQNLTVITLDKVLDKLCEIQYGKCKGLLVFSCFQIIWHCSNWGSSVQLNFEWKVV